MVEKPTVKKSKITKKTSRSHQQDTVQLKTIYVCIQRELPASNQQVLLQLVCMNITTAKCHHMLN